MDILVDTNVILRRLDRLNPHYSPARQALNKLHRRGDRLVTTTQNLGEAWAVLTRPAAKNGIGLQPDQAGRVISQTERLLLGLPDHLQHSRLRPLSGNHRPRPCSNLMLSFPDLASHLHSLTLAVPPLLRDWDSPYPGSSAWTRRELLGHLIDSALNNHQRFVRAAIEGQLHFPSYPQIEMVALQQYRHAPTDLLVTLWQTLNQQIARILSLATPSHRAALCYIGSNPAMTYEQMALDYVAHLEHHLRQLTSSHALPWSGLPWPPPDRWQTEINSTPTP